MLRFTFVFRSALRCVQTVGYFRLLGRAVAKALQDCRLLDLPLSPVLYRLALRRRVDLYDIRKFDAALGEQCRGGGCFHGGMSQQQQARVGTSANVNVAAGFGA